MDFEMYMDTLKEHMSGKGLVTFVCGELRKWSEDYSRIEKLYQEAQENVMACLGEQTCKQLVRTISEQNGIMLFFAAVQGLRMNRDHFINPMNPDCT